MRKRLWPLGAALFLIAALVAVAAPFGLGATPATPALAANQGGPAAAGPLQVVGPGSGGSRRESAPPSNGPPPRTGPPSPDQPLIIPNFGVNVRANTDTQSPNLAQQEPSIAVNPTNPLNIVAAAKDERAGSNTKQIWIYTSTDGGVTWINQQFPLLAPASPYSSDPIVNFSDDGQCYVTALPYGGGANDGIQVARSTNGGITFSTGVHLPGSNNSSDKEWTWVDNFPSSPYYHRIYVAWMNFGSGNVIGFNYSTDRGVSWSPLVSVGNANQFPMPVVETNGDVLVTDYTGSAVGYRRSTNGGAGFGTLQTISSITNPPCPPDNAGCGIWRLSPIPANAVDPNNGDMVIVWADGRTSSNARVYYTRSTNSGATWSAAAQLAPPGVTNTYQVEPWVAADEQGTFHAVWYDDRANPNTSIFNIYYSQSTDDGATWSTAQVISTATSDLRIGIPSSYALAAGDYINVTAAQGNVYAAWTDTRQGSGEDIYTVRGIITQGTPTATATGTPPTATATATASATATPPPSATATRTVTPLPTATRTVTPAPTATSTVTPPPPTSTPIPLSATATHSPTVTPVPPSPTPVPPTQTPGGPSATPVPPSPTPPPPSATPIPPSATPVPPTQTPGGPSATPVPPSATPAPPTTTPLPTATNTPGPSPTPCSISFSDVHPSDYFYQPVLYLACHGVVSGYADGTFRPFANTTRSQMVKIVVLGFQKPITTPTSGYTFADVPPTFPFFAVIETAAADNIVSGYTCGGPGEPCDSLNRPYFRPYANVTRGQLSKIDVVAAGWPLQNPPTNSFEDVLPGSAFYQFVEAAYCRGIISGYTCGGPGEPCDPQNRPYFRQNTAAIRGQIAKIVYLSITSPGACSMAAP